jgi:uncharacterized protein
MEIAYQQKALTPAQLEALSTEVKRVLTELYGDRLDRVILYGSYARGDFHNESDVDYLVVLRDDEVKTGKEIFYMGDKIGGLSFDYDLFISAKPTSLVKFQNSDLLFYQNVRREGKRL